MTNRRWLILLMLIAAVLSGVALVARASGRESAYDGPGLTPSNVAALSSADTLRSEIPPQLQDLPLGSLDPVPGTVHALGYDSFAWVRSNEICLYHDLSAGCLGHIAKPIDIVVADADVVGAGDPLHVSGLATDEVRSVTVKLDDGRVFQADVVGNFYDVRLANDVGPKTPLTVQAQLNSGGVYAERVGSPQTAS